VCPENSFSSRRPSTSYHRTPRSPEATRARRPSAVNAIAQLPPGEGKLEPGQELDVLLLGPLA